MILNLFNNDNIHKWIHLDENNFCEIRKKKINDINLIYLLLGENKIKRKIDIKWKRIDMKRDIVLLIQL